MRHDGAEFGRERMWVQEPCNYASNMAYYHSTTRICDYPDWSIETDQIKALKRSYATLALGSAFWHGSYTYVGYSFDENLIAVVSYVGYQIMVQKLNSTSPIVNGLSDQPRMPGTEVIETLAAGFRDKPVGEWGELID